MGYAVRRGEDGESEGHLNDRVGIELKWMQHGLRQPVTSSVSFQVSHYRSGNSSRGTSREIDLALPGILLMSPFFSMVSTIWCTEGGETLKYLCMSVSAGGYPWILV